MNKTFYGTASITGSQRTKMIHTELSDPGLYNVYKQKNQNQLPKWTLKPKINHGSCFYNKKENIPPPGAYEVTGNIKQKVKLQNPNYRSDRYKQTNQKFNHQSNINLPSTLNTTISASFGYKGQSLLFKQKSNESPGPIYNPNKTMDEIRSKKIKNSCRGFGYGQKNSMHKSNNFVPGPGTYYQQRSLSPYQQQSTSIIASPKISTFGKSKRKYEITVNPLGPGQYKPTNYTISNSGHTFKFKGKLPQPMKFVNPTGPGTYDLPDTKCKKGPKMISTHHKNKKQDQIPNPFTYQCQRYPQNVLKQDKGCSLGQKINQPNNQSTKNPGPGTYQVSEDLTKPKLGGYMGRKVEKRKKNQIDDCFGKYNPNINISMHWGSMYSFKCQPKPWDKPQKDQTIGPGHYQIKQLHHVQGYKMGKSQRFKQNKQYRNFIVNNSEMTNQLNSTIGYMPSYLKQSATKLNKLKKQNNNT